MAPNARRRVGRTLRRSRRLSTRGTGAPVPPSPASALKLSGPLQAIEENTVVTLSEPSDKSHSATLHRFAAPPLKNPRKRRRESTKATKATAAPVQPDSQKRRRQLDVLLGELEAQVQERCEELVAEAERKAGELRMELKVQLLFLPESVRQMPWRTFVGDFGGSLANVIQTLAARPPVASPKPVKKASAASTAIKATAIKATAIKATAIKATAIKAKPTTQATAKKKRTSTATAVKRPRRSVAATPRTYMTRRLSALQTPLITTTETRNAVPKTVLRTARKGELTYSVRGSPILPESAARARADSVIATFSDDDTAAACLTLEGDHALDLSAPEHLTDESRAAARSKLEALQAKVSELLLKLH